MSNPSPWFTIPEHRPDAQYRVFCFPYAGGGATSFRSWATRMPQHIELVIVQLPGRENRFSDSFITSLDEVVNVLYSEFSKLWPAKPFVFFGHSVGALIAYELSRRLQYAADVLPKLLIAAGKRAPHIPIKRKPLHTLAPDEFRSMLIEFNGTPQVVLDTPEMYELFIPRLRADFEINETYRYMPGEPLSCPIAVFGGRDDRETSVETLEAWKQHTGGSFSVTYCEGDHFFIHANEDEMIKLISTFSDEVIEPVKPMIVGKKVGVYVD